MQITRRDFLKYTAAMAGILGLTAAGLIKLHRLLAAEIDPRVVWLKGQSCTGCSISLLNTIYYITIDALLRDTIDLEFHSTLMAASGNLAASAAEAAYIKGGYILVVEGAIPTKEAGRYCYLWLEMTALKAIQTFGKKADFILAVGNCAAYGGVVAGGPNPTMAKGVGEILEKEVINIPGCPAHPDWIVGTIAHLLTYGEAPELDNYCRPKDYYLHSVCSRCELLEFLRRGVFTKELSKPGCLYELGCRGPETHADCPIRKWNSSKAKTYGVNWCVGGGSPCKGCTEPNFPDAMPPFFVKREVEPCLLL
jgi:hydrogenase small subunit